MPDAPEPPEEAATVDEPPKQPELKEEVNVSGGRRRGKRQVMKKKTIKDEEGYLGKLFEFLLSRVAYLTLSVTVEEPSWESFSEDEPAPPKKKPAVSSTAKGKTGGKPGQGNIMSFFSRK